MRKLLADTLFNPNGDTSWEQFQADEEARERFIEYCLDGRL